MLLAAVGLLLVSPTDGVGRIGFAFPGQRINNVQIPQVGPQPDFQMQILPNQFLVKAGSGANTSIIFTPINNFSGIVNISGSVSPTGSSAPTISLPAVAKVNWTISGIPHYFMIVSTTGATQLGLYTVTIYGVSGGVSHIVTVTIGVTNLSVPSNGAEMLYRGNFTSAAYADRSVVLNNSFEDLGYLSIGVWQIVVVTSFGTYTDILSASCVPNCWFATVSPFNEKATNFTIQIPANTSPGNYTVTITVSWILQPGTLYQTAGPDLVTHGSIIVHSSPLAWSPYAVIGGIAAAAVLVPVLVFWNQKRRKLTRESQRSFQEASHPVGATSTCPRCGAISLEPRFCDECGLKLS